MVTYFAFFESWILDEHNGKGEPERKWKGIGEINSEFSLRERENALTKQRNLYDNCWKFNLGKTQPLPLWNSLNTNVSWLLPLSFAEQEHGYATSLPVPLETTKHRAASALSKKMSRGGSKKTQGNRWVNLFLFFMSCCSMISAVEREAWVIENCVNLFREADTLLTLFTWNVKSNCVCEGTFPRSFSTTKQTNGFQRNSTA